MHDAIYTSALPRTFDGTWGYDTGFTTNMSAFTIFVRITSGPAAPSDGLPSGPAHRKKAWQMNWDHHEPQSRGAALVYVGGVWYRASFGQLQPNTDYDLIMTFKPATASQQGALKAYIGTQLKTTVPTPIGSGPSNSETIPAYLGKHAGNPQYWIGQVNLTQFFDYCATDQQIGQFYGMNEIICPDPSCHGL